MSIVRKVITPCLWFDSEAEDAANLCGWLKDKFGLSWQVVPSALPKLMTAADPAASARVMNAFMKMKKFDIATLEQAVAG